MVVSPSRPWNIPIYRLANQVMAKGCGSVERLDKESRPDQLLDVSVIHEVVEDIRIGVRPRRRGELQSPPGPLRDPIGQEEDRVADRLRERHVLRRTEIHDVALVSKSSGGCEDRRELLDEERKALGALVDGGRQGPSGSLSEDASHQLRCVRRVEGVELHLPESVRSPQLGAEPAQRMPPRDLVGSIGGQDEQSLVLERDGQPVEQVQGFRVGPMQVIEEHHRRVAATDLVEGPPSGFHQRLLVRPFRRRAELGKEQREVPFEGSDAPQAVGHGPQVRTQHADDRSVRRAFRRGRPSQDEQLAAGESLVGKSGLPHSCLARDQDEPALATPNLGQDIRQHRKLCLSADQLDLVGHR